MQHFFPLRCECFYWRNASILLEKPGFSNTNSFTFVLVHFAVSLLQCCIALMLSYGLCVKGVHAHLDKSPPVKCNHCQTQSNFKTEVRTAQQSQQKAPDQLEVCKASVIDYASSGSLSSIQSEAQIIFRVQRTQIM